MSETKEATPLKPFLRSLLKETSAKVRQCELELDTCRENAKKALCAVETAEKNFERELRILQAVKEKITAIHGLPPVLVGLRNSMANKLLIAESKDITVGTLEGLRGEISKLKAELVRNCNHKLVVGYNGYAGSRSDDYDDKYPGRRICLVCGFVESSESCKEDVYAVLAEKEGRLIKRDYKDQFKKGNILDFSIEFINTLFYNSAGSWNLKYDEAKD